MLEYLKDKYKQATGEVEVKENIVKGVNSIGYVDVGSSVKFDLSATLILAEMENTGKTLPLLETEYKEDSTIKKLVKEKLSDDDYSLKCFLDDDNENMLQVNVIDNNIDSAIIYKRYDRMFYNANKGVFIDSTGETYEKSLWLDTIMENQFFQIFKDEKCYEYEKVYNKSVINTQIKEKDKTRNTKFTEVMFHRGIESNEVNREIILISCLENVEEVSMSIYIGVDVSSTSLRIS